MKRVKIVTALRRPVPSKFFERISAALLRGAACTCAT
jgi:hypothetical protein